MKTECAGTSEMSLQRSLILLLHVSDDQSVLCGVCLYGDCVTYKFVFQLVSHSFLSGRTQVFFMILIIVFPNNMQYTKYQ
jgi:hypothetical protein